jgi:AcrR family transcriptional regulator
MAKRRYEQRARAATAEQTRRRVLDAVYTQLQAAPTTPVSIDAVARSAGVARSTVYAVFGSRAGLFTALGVDLLDRAGFDRVVAAVAVPGVRASLRAGMHATVAIYVAQSDIFRALHAMALLDPDAYAGAVQPVEQDRAGGVAHLARRLAAAGELRPDVDEAEATDLLWLVTGFDAFDVLHTQRGLPAGAIADRLIAVAERTLCGEPAGPDPTEGRAGRTAEQRNR